MALLEVKSLTKRFGGLTALDDLNLDIDEGEIRGLIGPNGAGKTTFINVVSGSASATRGKVIFKGEDITNLTTDRIAKKGLARTFQATSLFRQHTVLENLIVAQALYRNKTFWGALLGLPSECMAEARVRKEAERLLETMGLTAMRNELANNLPHGYQRMLGVAIALATRPKLLLLDEPVTGMNLEEMKAMVDIIKKIRDHGITILLVEHSVRTVMSICDKITVLNFGRKIAAGSPGEIQNNASVIEAYLGVEEEDGDGLNPPRVGLKAHSRTSITGSSLVRSQMGYGQEPESRPSAAVLLDMKDVVVNYGKVRALKGVSLSVEEGMMVFLIGSNGAGKTTTLRTVSGLERPVSGEIRFKGERIDAVAPAKIVSMGIIHVPEGRRIFPYMSILENLKLGAYLRTDNTLAEDLDRVYQYFPILKTRTGQKAGSLSGGEQQMLAIARALMGRPTLLLMDEPSIGLAPKVVQDIGRIIDSINKIEKVAIILVEQNARLALRLGDKGYVLETGHIILEGKREELSKDERVKKAYLGG